MVGYDKDTKNKMCTWKKTETRRLFNPNRRPGIPGHTQRIKIDRTKKVYGEYIVTSCEPSTLGQMTKRDAINEGFNNIKEYKEYFYKVNGYIPDNELIWVMKFALLWVCKEGIILE